MKNKKEKKSILIGVLLCAVALMGIGYAALASQLDINGTASISSKKMLLIYWQALNI